MVVEPTHITEASMISASREQLDFLSWFGGTMRPGAPFPSQAVLRKAMGKLSMDFCDDQGRSPMGYLCGRTMKQFDQQREQWLFAQFLERGANPLAHGNPLRKALTHASRGGSMFNRLVEREQSNPADGLRGDDLGNAMHDLMEINPIRASERLAREEPQSPVWGWLEERRLVDGYTPAHLLWVGLARRQKPGQKPADSPYSDEVVQALNTVRYMISHGTDLTVLDDFGQSAAQLGCAFLLEHKVPTGHRTVLNMLRKVAATTPVANDGPQMGGRRVPRL